MTTLPVLDTANHRINHYLVDCFIHRLAKWGLLFTLVFKHKYHIYFWMTDSSKVFYRYCLIFPWRWQAFNSFGSFCYNQSCTYSVNQQYTIFKEWIQNLWFAVHWNYVMFNKWAAVFYQVYFITCLRLMILDPIKQVLRVYWMSSNTFLEKHVSVELITRMLLWTSGISIQKKY